MSRPLTKEEFEAMDKELTAVLEKHDCEIIVESKILILKRGDPLKVEEMPKEEGTPSPFVVKDNGDKGTTIEEGPKA